MGVSVAVKRIKPDPAEWRQLVDRALRYWMGRVNVVVLEELEQVGLTRLYLESERWNGEGSWTAYALQRISWSMVDWLRIEGYWTSHASGRSQRDDAANEIGGWRDHPELPPAKFYRPPRIYFGEPGPHGGLFSLEETLPSPNPNPEEILAQKEMSQTLRRLVAGMSDPRTRRVISLRLEGLKFREIAHLMKCSLSRVGQLSRLGIDELKRTAKRQGFERGQTE